MFELNDQELWQVVGGSGSHYGSNSNTSGAGSADLGAIETHSASAAQVNAQGAKSYAWNDTLVIGVNAAATSSSNSGSGASN